MDATTKRLQSVRHAELKLQVLLRMTQPIVPMSPMPFPALPCWKVKALREVKLQFWPGAKSVRAGIPTDAEVWAAITCVHIHSHKNVDCVQAQLHIILQAIRVWNQCVTYFTINRLLSFMWMSDVPNSHHWLDKVRPFSHHCFSFLDDT